MFVLILNFAFQQVTHVYTDLKAFDKLVNYLLAHSQNANYLALNSVFPKSISVVFSWVIAAVVLFFFFFAKCNDLIVE